MSNQERPTAAPKSWASVALSSAAPKSAPTASEPTSSQNKGASPGATKVSEATASKSGKQPISSAKANSAPKASKIATKISTAPSGGSSAISAAVTPVGVSKQADAKPISGAKTEKMTPSYTTSPATKASTSWAALASSSTPARKSASSPKPKQDPVPVETSTRRKNEHPKTTSQPHSITVPSDGWAGLPPDVVTHHLYIKLNGNMASIKVMRRVCRSWAAALPLSRINLEKFSAPLGALPSAARICKELVARGSENGKLVIALQNLKHSVHLETLDVFFPLSGVEPSTYRLLAEVISTCPNLTGVTLYAWSARAPAMDAVLNALRSCKPLRRLIVGSILDLALLLQDLKSLQLEELRLDRGLGSDETKLLQEYLVGTTTLKKFSLLSAFHEQFYPTVIEGVKRNRSIKEFSITGCGNGYSAAGERLLWDTVSQHPTIERLESMDFHSHFNQLETMEFILKAVNLKRINIPSRGKTVWGEFQEDLMRSWLTCLEEGRNFSGFDVSALVPYSQGHYYSRVVDALKRDKSFKFLQMDISNLHFDLHNRERHYKLAADLLEGNLNIEDVHLSLITGPIDNIARFANGLARAKAVKRLQTTFPFDENTKSNAKAVAAGLSKLATVEEIRLTGPFYDEAALLLAQGIAKHKRLRVLELPSSMITSVGATSLIDAAANAGTLRILDLSNAKIENTNTAFNIALEKCLRSCPLEFLSLRGASVDPSTINIIINTLRSLDACFLKDLDLGEVNMSHLIRQRLDSFILERGGLITLDVDPTRRDQRQRGFHFIPTLV
eukprot:TRINITY_DN4897_c0_g1_i1.p1 TRINITY_DN4897_c0_g1~~TRINITY_DN4897_c0_g1_i1.p1  ORF type:complete len:788 (+),score=80.34 TRINITY_DN4897_c0_g1_i1:109-2472(+)